MQKTKIIVLDRDGVINEDSDAYIKNPAEFFPVAGTIEAIAKLKKAGFIVAVATNQSGLKRGYYDRATLSEIHLKLQNLLAEKGAKIDWISFSPYLPECGSVCRKPKTGMLKAIENRFGFELAGSYMVGDTIADVKVAKAHGLKPILVRSGKGERTIAGADPALAGVPIFDNLLAFVESIL